VIPSEVFFDAGKATLDKAEGRAELDGLAAALLELEKKIPGEIGWVLRVDGHTDVRPINSPQFKSNWELRPGARSRWCNISLQKGLAAAPRRRRIRRVPADRAREDRGSLCPQPSHRAQADRALNVAFVIEDDPRLRQWPTCLSRFARIGPPTRTRQSMLWRRTWQLAYPAIDFSARLEWWRQRWRNELVPAATITVAEANGQLIGFVTVDPRTLDLDQIVVAPEDWGSGVASALVEEAKRISPEGLDLHVNTDNVRAIRFYEKQGFVVCGEAMNWRSGAPVHKMTWRP